METITALKSIDQAIAGKLAERAEAERKKLEAEDEQNLLREAGKEPFYEALAERIARDYGIDIRQEAIKINYVHEGGSGPAYNFELFVHADEPKSIKVEAWIGQKWANSAEEITRSTRRDSVWVARRRALFDGPDEGPVTLYAEFSDFVDALIWAKTGK